MKNSLAGMISGSVLVAMLGCSPDAGDEATGDAQITETQRQSQSTTPASSAQQPNERRLPQLAETAKRGIEQIGGAGGGVHVTPTLPSATDLEQRVRRELAETQGLELSAAELAEVDIQVEGEIVQLSGTVPNEEVAEKIEQRVTAIGGVDKVENYLIAGNGE